MNGRLFLTIITAAFSVNACYNIGPKTIPRDWLDYNVAISNPWKEQTLLNIVVHCYADMPLFVDISSAAVRGESDRQQLVRITSSMEEPENAILSV